MKRLLHVISFVGLLALACDQQPPPPLPTAAALPTRASATPTPAPTVAPTPTIRATPVPPTPTPGPPSRLALDIVRANRAFDQGQFRSAAELYAQALQPVEATDESPLRRLRAFAHFRLGLAALLDRQEGRARQVLQEESRDEPDPAFRQMAFQLWDAYAMTGDAVAGCARASSFAVDHAVRIELAANAIIGPTEICLVPPSPRALPS